MTAISLLDTGPKCLDMHLALTSRASHGSLQPAAARLDLVVWQVRMLVQQEPHVLAHRQAVEQGPALEHHPDVQARPRIVVRQQPLPRHTLGAAQASCQRVFSRSMFVSYIWPSRDGRSVVQNNFKHIVTQKYFHNLFGHLRTSNMSATMSHSASDRI